MRSQLKNKKGIFFSPIEIWTMFLWNNNQCATNELPWLLNPKFGHNKKNSHFCTFL